jgi:hypothetical protein
VPRIPGIPGPYLVVLLQFRLQRAHARRDRQQAKFWLAPVALAWNHGFSAREVNEIRRLVVDHEHAIVEAWHEHCGQR